MVATRRNIRPNFLDVNRKFRAVIGPRSGGIW